MQDLTMQLNKLWAGIIKKIEFDLLRASITLNVKVIEHGEVSDFEVIFTGVSSQYFIKNNGNSRFSNIEIEVEEGDYLELTSIDYFEPGVGDITVSSNRYEWVDEYFSSANFVLEIWSSILFIEAKSIKINDINYDNLIKFS